MPEKKTVHIWMLDGRSLCDRRALPGRRADEPEEEREAARQESAAAPACGACLLLAGRIRREAATILERHPKVHPAKPSAAWDSLRGTRWSTYFDLDALEDQAAAVDESSSYDAMRSALHPNLVEDLSAEWDRLIASGQAIDDDEIGFKGPTQALS